MGDRESVPRIHGWRLIVFSWNIPIAIGLFWSAAYTDDMYLWVLAAMSMGFQYGYIVSETA
jgi:hypothetical protein